MISALFVTAAAAQQTPPQPPTGADDNAGPRVTGAGSSDCQLAASHSRSPSAFPALSCAGQRRDGLVSLSFSIDRQGHALNSKIIKSSGSAVLDAEALSLITRAAPLPPPPAAVPDTDLTFVLPIRFEGSSKQ
jgi:protein TonB